MKFISNQIKQTYKDKNIFHSNDVEQINTEDVFVSYDTFSVENVADVFETKGTPGLFVSDCIVHYENFYKNVEFLGLPIWLNHGRKIWKPEEFSDAKPETKYCFNFMVNRKQVNRYLCIKLVELLKLKNFTYSWSGSGNCFDCSVIIEEQNQLGTNNPLSQSQFSELLAPVNLNPRFIQSDGYKDIKKDETNNGVAGYGGIRSAWDWGIDKMFAQSAVSLITETIHYQKAIMFSEKTLYSLLGLNFPIWIGGHKQAEMWKRLGFDTFEDVIDHDYQYCDTLLERCSYAFVLNKKILSDLDYANSIREKYLERLFYNRKMILSSDKIQNYIDTELQKHCHRADDFYNEVMKKFTGSQWPMNATNTYIKDN